MHKPAQTGTNRHRPAQTGTNRHKPAQTGTNRHRQAQTGTNHFCHRRGEAHLPPSLLVPATIVTLLQSAASPLVQTSTSQHIFVATGGGKLTCPLFIVCYSSRPHPRTFAEGGGPRNVRRMAMRGVGGFWRWGVAKGRTRSPPCSVPLVIGVIFVVVVVAAPFYCRCRGRFRPLPFPHSPTLLFLARSEQCFCSVMIIDQSINQ